MARWTMIAALAAMVGGVATAADKAAKGLEQGDPLGAFHVSKVAGADGDGVEQGQQLCYRCRYGQRPMVLVFARQMSEPLAELVGKLDAAVAKHDDQQLKAVVTLLGDDAKQAEAQAKKLAEKVGAKQVPVVVSQDGKAGPANYQLDPNAEITVVLGKDSQVVAMHRFSASDIDAAKVLAEAEQLVKQ